MNRLKFIDRMAQGKVTRRQMIAGAGAFGVGLTVMSRMPKADPLVCLEWAGYDTPDHFGSYVAKHGAPPSFSIFANERKQCRRSGQDSMPTSCIPAPIRSCASPRRS